MVNQIGQGDLARMFLMQKTNFDVKAEVTRLAQELSTGRKADVAAAVGGDFAPITSIETTLARNASYKTTGTEAASLAAVMQNAYQTISTLIEESSGNMLNAGQATQASVIETAAADTAAKLAPVLAALNTTFGSRSVFSGVAVDGPAVADAETFMASLTATTAGATDVASLTTALDAWFAPGGGFETDVYLGSTTPLAPIDIGLGVKANLQQTAFDGELRDALKGIALANLIDNDVLTGNTEARAELVRIAGETMLRGETGLTTLQARLGTVEGLIEETGVARDTETSALTLARAEILEVDPYETASRLTAAQTQLETIYAITARMQSLSLVNYL
ncbi:flagellin [Oceanicola sp. 502str15]|uniref:flagellin n=1 Tax=Oceanicola sp. 502str15 TaxID=2696061 RepID=UPI00209625D8|nr:flagellin [Oceanicola sp. 502str15]MCO6384789.1 hypothetical protein [Oceanicola sp. 502str15]